MLSGSSVNIISEAIMKQMNPLPSMQLYNKNVFAFNSDVPIPFKGAIFADAYSPDTKINVHAEFLVMETADPPILGYSTAVALNLLHIGPPTQSVNAISDSELSKILVRYNNRFTGLGEVKDVKVKIQIDPSIAPIAQKPRRLPILLQKEVDKEIDKLLDLGVLEKVGKPPTWLNPLHIVSKKTTEAFVFVLI